MGTGVKPEPESLQPEDAILIRPLGDGMWIDEGGREWREPGTKAAASVPRIDPDARAWLTELRSAGWSVAVHNDYRKYGRLMTFWLLTNPNGRYVKGEGLTDEEALEECAEAILEISRG